MNIFDLGLALVALVCVVVGLRKGLARIAIALVSLIVAFLLASQLEGRAAAWLMSVRVSETPARFTAYLAIFLATMIAGGGAAWLVGRILKLAMLSWADRLAGGALGLLGALLAAALVVHPIAAASPGGALLLRDSWLAPYVTVVADVANVGAPKDLAARYAKGAEALRRIWRGDVTPGIERALAPLRD
jgi:membrane protein required for colicin V production